MNFQRIIKKIIIAFLTIVSIFPFVGVHATENVYDVWKKEALVYPYKGQLVPAGQIEIQFSSLLNTNFDIECYEIYFDGKKQETIQNQGEELLKCDIYTTEVSSHTIQVVAVTKDKKRIHSSLRTFFVSKKGMGLDSKAKMDDMNISWYYNWSLTPHMNMNKNIQFVPMIYGVYSGASQWLLENGKLYPYILGFNEPDREDQANLLVNQAVSFQKYFTNTNSIIGAPAVSYDPSVNQWFIEYAQKINMNDIDFIPVHVYYDWAGEGMAQSFLKVIDDTYKKYKKPIWVTEYGIANQWLYGSQSQSEEMEQQLQQFMKETIEGLEKRAYVERYTWFSFGTDDINGGKTALYNQKTGQLTQLGKLYKQLGNPHMNVNYEDQYIEDTAYYGQLDALIQKAETITLTDDFKNHYIVNEKTFNEALKSAKDISRHLTILQQDQIQKVSIALEKEINSLKLKSADYRSLYQLMEESMKHIGKDQTLKKAYEDALHLDKHLTIKQQDKVDKVYTNLKTALQKVYDQKNNDTTSPAITIEYAQTYVEYIVEHITNYIYEEEQKTQEVISKIDENNVPQSSASHQHTPAQSHYANIVTLCSIAMLLLLVGYMKKREV